jgi:hypothetical protein
MTVVYLIVAALIVAAIYFGIRYFVRASQLFSGERVIICPETGKQAMVEIDTKHAAISSLLGQTDLRLESCARWPFKQDCGQECLLQFDVASAECLVRSVLEKWYRDKNCAFCERPFAEISMVDHKPALLDAEGVTVEWQRIPLSAMTEVMATYLPVCWNCHVAQSFRREHPELVVDRTLIRSQPPSQSNQSPAHR